MEYAQERAERSRHADRSGHRRWAGCSAATGSRSLLADELPENDCPPVRVKVLSERLVAFRDSRGRYGLIDEFCAHRGVVAVVRPQRGVRPALPLSRLEVRRDRPVHRGALRARGERLRQEDQAEVLSAGRARRRAVDLYGAARDAAAAAGMGIRAWCRPSSASSPSACRNATGCRRWKAASIPATSPSCIAATSIRSAVQGRQGQPVQSQRHAAGVRGGRERRRPLHRRAPQCRERQLLLAHHANG